VRRVLERLYGKEGFLITLTSPAAPNVTLHYTAWKQITGDIDDARIFGGIHFRYDQEAGRTSGMAGWLLHSRNSTSTLLARLTEPTSSPR
jgi:hypothetical protein